jgi:hypothetical protein
MKRLLLAALFMVPALASAQVPLWEEAKPKPKPDCLDGVKYDDGKLESGLAGLLDFRTNLVMLFEAPSYPARLDKVCLAWSRSIIGDRGIYFDLRIWDANGENGGPGTLLAQMGGLSAGKLAVKSKWYTYDLSSQGIVINGPVYIGPSYFPGDAFYVFLGMDTGPKTPRRRGFFGANVSNPDAPPGREMGFVGNQPSYRAYGIRVKFTPVP